MAFRKSRERMAEDEQKVSERHDRAVAFADRMSFENLLTTMQSYHATRRYWMIAGVGFVVSAILCVLIDITMPMKGFGWNFIRSLMALVMGAFDFMIAYSLAMFQSLSNERHYDDNVPIDIIVDPYQPIRLRYSFRQRRRQTYPFIAVIFVIAIASAYSHLYSLLGGVVVAGVVAICAYLRPTDEEKVFIRNDMPDPRDIVDFAEEYQQQETERKAKEKAKALRKARKAKDGDE